MERRAGSREKAQKINIERRTPNIERRKRVGSGESRNQELGKLECWSIGVLERERSRQNEIGDRQKRAETKIEHPTSNAEQPTPNGAEFSL